MQRIGLILLLQCVAAFTCLSQQYSFVQYTPRDGLVSNRAHLMIQDRKGLLYVATYGGLSVYDGYRFSNFTSENGLASNIINDIVEMGEDSVWIIPNFPKLQCLCKGVIRDIVTADHYYPIINRIIRDASGSYYALADQGLFRYDSNRFIKVPLSDSNGRDLSKFLANGAGIGGKLMLITDPDMKSYPSPARLIEYDPHSKKVAVCLETYVHTIASTPSGGVLVSTDKGIRQLDMGAFQRNLIRLKPLSGSLSTASSLIPTDMFFDHQRNLWLLVAGGIIRISPNGQQKIFSEKNGLPLGSQQSIFQDREDIIWVLNGHNGICKLLNPVLELYPEYESGFNATDVFADPSKDSIWFLDAYGKTILLQSGGHAVKYKLQPDKWEFPCRLIASSGNIVFLADAFHVFECRFLPGRRVIRRLLFEGPILPDNNTPRGFNCLLPMPDGSLLVSDENIAVLTPGGKSFRFPIGHFFDNFFVDKKNRLWIASRDKRLLQYQLHPGDPAHYLQLIRDYNAELPPFSPRSLVLDQEENVWIGSRDHGLFCFLFHGDSLAGWKQIRARDGLSDNFIYYLHADSSDNIWACSPAGLDRIRMQHRHPVIDNLTRSSNTYLYVNKIQTSRSEVHWAISSLGLIRIASDSQASRNFIPRILLREIREGSSRIEDPSSLLRLAHNQNNLKFSLAAPSFIDEKQTRFSYLLEGGTDTSWSDPSAVAEINLVNLPPGNYCLRAKALFLHGLYPPCETSCVFIIAAPWWQTFWFRSLAAMAILVSLIVLVRSYYQRKLRQKEIAMEKQRAVDRERSRIAADMHDDLGSGLTEIRFLGDRVKNNSFNEITREDIEKIQQTSNELIDKMNEIIWTMNEKNDSLESLIFYTRAYALEYLEENNLECSFILPEMIPDRQVSGETRRNIFLTVKESLHNIVKHASAKNVGITVSLSRNLVIRIADDGMGLIRKEGFREGNGLNNMHRRIENVGGRMTILNEKGFTVTIEVPVG